MSTYQLLCVLDERRGRGSELGRQLRGLLVVRRRHAAVHKRALGLGRERELGALEVLQEGGSAAILAVNEGALLTEPWTDLLIRAFAKACVYHLTAAEDVRRASEWQMMMGHPQQEGHAAELRASLSMTGMCA